MLSRFGQALFGANRGDRETLQSIRKLVAESDPIDNLKSTPPESEKIEVHAIWMLELFSPGNFENLHGGWNRLEVGPLPSRGDPARLDAQNTRLE